MNVTRVRPLQVPEWRQGTWSFGTRVETWPACTATGAKKDQPASHLSAPPPPPSTQDQRERSRVANDACSRDAPASRVHALGCARNLHRQLRRLRAVREELTNARQPAQELHAPSHDVESIGAPRQARTSNLEPWPPDRVLPYRLTTLPQPWWRFYVFGRPHSPHPKTSRKLRTQPCAERPLPTATRR